MKKCKKIIAAILLLAICLVATGCVNIKELRKTHGIWADEGQMVIQLNGKEYKKLPYADDRFNIDGWQQIFVTTKDVPVLLAQTGSSFLMNKKEILLQDQTLPYEGGYYCRSDYYDAVVEEYQKGVVFTRYIYEYYDDETEKDKVYELTKEQINAIERVAGDETLRSDIDTDSLFSSPYITCYSEGEIFRKDYGYILKRNEEYYFVEEENYESYCYRVPVELNSVFDEIMYAYETYSFVY
ncbi:MAG: hypothetical protein IJN34_06410 [Clostridia bacterium]|nr:hypothetical protein [Clostridia bacterium]